VACCTETEHRVTEIKEGEERNRWKSGVTKSKNGGRSAVSDKRGRDPREAEEEAEEEGKRGRNARFENERFPEGSRTAFKLRLRH
jgi:hypothetical protein